MVAVLAAVAAFLLLRIVLHGYTGHGYLDVFHLTVGVVTGGVGLWLARRALSPGV